MGKPVYWWCLKNDAGNLLPGTATQYYVRTLGWRKRRMKVICIRVEEVPEKGKGGGR